MIEKISFQYPWWFILFCLALGAIYAWILYRKENKFSEGPHWLKPLMALLRFLSVSTIAFLLIGPIVKSLKEEQKDPIIVFLEDKSSSIPAGMNNAQLTSYIQKLEKIKKALGEKFKVETLSFGDEVSQDKIEKFDFKGTNLSNALRYVYENYADQNLGSIILASDGIYNEGSNPAYEQIKFGAPVHCIALGDTSLRKDLSVRNILHNKIAYLGDKFSIQVDVSANNCNGQASKLRVEKVNGESKKLISEIPVNIDGTSFFKTYELNVDADETGIVKYSISLVPLNGEITTINNKKDIYIEVLDGRQNILIYANSPHPDISALNTLISSNKNYKVKTAFPNNGPKPNIAEFNLVIYHNLPSDQNDISAELAVAKNKNIPSLFIAGTQISQNRFNVVQDVVRIKGNNKNNEDAEASFNGGFNQFTISEALKTELNKFPPLTTLFGIYEAIPGSSILLYQKIKKVPTKYPLIAFADKGGTKTGVIIGEGLWKWRLTDFVDNNNFENIGELVNKIVQLVTVKDDKRKFRVNLPKNLFKENENILLDAQLYNDAYEMINESDVFLTIKDQKNKEYKYNFSKTNNYYTLDAGLFPEGNYTYTATTNYKGAQLSESGKFSVQSIQLEQYDLTARHDVMRGISGKFNGSTYYVNNMDALSDLILKNDKIKPLLFQTSQSKSILHYKWIFFLILALLSLEWFLRRYFGSY